MNISLNPTVCLRPDSERLDAAEGMGEGMDRSWQGTAGGSPGGYGEWGRGEQRLEGKEGRIGG